MNFIDTLDVAEAARVVLLEQVIAQPQRAYHLTGPQAWTMQQVAQELSRLLEFPVVYHRRSPSEQRAWLLADGASPLLADVIIGPDALFEASALAERTFTVEQLTGHPPRSLTDWLSEKLERFRRSTDKPR